MSLEPIDTHFGEAIVKLIPPFWGKPRMASVLRAMIRRVQEFEDDCWTVLEAFHIDTADAPRLTILGKVVGQPNFGWSTDTYRAVIRGKIAANRSRGLEEDIRQLLVLVGQFTTPSVVYHLSPATLLVQPTGTVSADIIEALLFLLPKTRAAGVALHVYLSPDSATEDYDYSSVGLIFSDFLDDTTTPGSPWFDVRHV